MNLKKNLYRSSCLCAVISRSGVKRRSPRRKKKSKNKRKHGSLESEWIVLSLSIMKTLLNYKKN